MAQLKDKMINAGAYSAEPDFNRSPGAFDLYVRMKVEVTEPKRDWVSQAKDAIKRCTWSPK